MRRGKKMELRKGQEIREKVKSRTREAYGHKPKKPKSKYKPKKNNKSKALSVDIQSDNIVYGLYEDSSGQCCGGYINFG